MTPHALLSITCLVTSAITANVAQDAKPDTVLIAARLSARVAAPPVGVRQRRVVSRESGDGRPEVRSADVANSKALAEPLSSFSVGAVQVYAWREGAIYRLYTAPDQVSDITLQPGEGLVSVAAGDTARWIVGNTTSGSGANRRAHVLVKPTAADLRTNLVIATDRRVYHLELESNSRAGAASVAWSYPDDTLLALEAKLPQPQQQTVATDVTVEALNFDYRIEGASAPWRPVRAFDDGRQVFIEFPPTVAQGEAPPLFVLGDDGKAELVNYRLRGRYYVVDRLFSAAELRLGEKHQLVVRILREGSRTRRRSS